MPLQPRVLKPASNAFDFRVYDMDDAGKPVKVYHPHEEIATVVIRICNLTRAMLREELVISAFEQLAIRYCRLKPNAWFLQEEQPGKATEKQETKMSTDEKAKIATHAFLDPLQIKWPFLVVSHRLKNPVCSAFTFRAVWHGEFDVSKQYIVLNGRRIEHMLGAAILAQTSQDKDGGDSKDSRNFEFLFATVMLHELCHVFFTYLTKGHHFTPPSMKASVATAAPKNQGESGYLIEEMVFGGPISIFRDPIVGSSETSSGVPYIRTMDGTYEIGQEIIDKTVSGEFGFPLGYNLRNEKYVKHQGLSPYLPPLEEYEDIFLNPAWPAFLATPFPHKPE